MALRAGQEKGAGKNLLFERPFSFLHFSRGRPRARHFLPFLSGKKRKELQSYRVLRRVCALILDALFFPMEFTKRKSHLISRRPTSNRRDWSSSHCLDRSYRDFRVAPLWRFASACFSISICKHPAENDAWRGGGGRGEAGGRGRRRRFAANVRERVFVAGTRNAASRATTILPCIHRHIHGPRRPGAEFATRRKRGRKK